MSSSSFFSFTPTTTSGVTGSSGPRTGSFLQAYGVSPKTSFYLRWFMYLALGLLALILGIQGSQDTVDYTLAIFVAVFGALGTLVAALVIWYKVEPSQALGIRGSQSSSAASKYTGDTFSAGNYSNDLGF